MAIDINDLLNKIKSGGSRWTAALNGAPRPLGAIVDSELLARARLTEPTAWRDALPTVVPTSVDWRNRNGRSHVTPVKNQASYGACTAFGTCASVESMASILLDVQGLDLSEADHHFCSAHGVEDTGWDLNQALLELVRRGVADEEYFRWDQTSAAPMCVVRNDRLRRAWGIEGFLMLFGQMARKIWLAHKGPACAAFDVYEDFDAYTGGVYHHLTGQKRGSHCVQVVGYDDSAGAWICKNSWGPTWGENGFFRIAYGECGIDTNPLWAITGVRRPLQVPIPDVTLTAIGRPSGHRDSGGGHHGFFAAADRNLYELLHTDGAVSKRRLSAPGLGPAIAGAPASYLHPDGSQHVFYRGFDGHIHELWATGASWNVGDLTGYTGAPLAAGDPCAMVDPGDNAQHVYYRGLDGHIHELTWRPGGSWVHVDLTQKLRPPPVVDPTAMIGTLKSATDAWKSAWPAPDFSRLGDLVGGFGLSIDMVGSPIKHPEPRIDIDGAKNRIRDWVNGLARPDIEALKNSVATQLDSGLRDLQRLFRDYWSFVGSLFAVADPACFIADRVLHVVYPGVDGHVHELWSSGGDSWGHTDLTANTGGPIALGRCSGLADSQRARVFHRGLEGSIHLLQWGSGAWATQDLTAATSAPRAACNPVALSGFLDGRQRLFYLGFDGHIHELWDDGAWHHTDATLRANAPLATGDPAAYVAGQTMRVLHCGLDGNLHELRFDNAWHHRPLGT